MNPRPLGYEPYDIGLWRLGQSLTGVVTSADRTDPVSLRRLRLPRLGLSRRVRFTNRFTEQAIDLQFPVPFPPFRSCHPWAPYRARAHQTTPPPVSPTLNCYALAVSPPPRLYQGTGRAAVLPRSLPRTRLLRDLTAGGFCPGSAWPITQ